MRSARCTRAAMAGFLLAASWTGLGWVYQARSGIEHDDPRVVVVGVGGTSWPTLRELSAAGRLPTLSAVIEGESNGADIVAAGYRDPGEVLASVVTGKFPGKHGVSGMDEGWRFRRDGAPGRVPVWELMSRRGQSVAVIGFPFWAPIAAEDSWVLPDWPTFSRHLALYRNGREESLPPEWRRHVLAPESVPADLLERVRRGRELSADRIGALRRALAADLTLTALAGEIYRTSPATHLFVYLCGLRELEREMAGDADASLIADYHVTVDELLRRLRAWDDGSTTFLLFSEQAAGANGRRQDSPQAAGQPPTGWMFAWGRGVERNVVSWVLSPVDIAATLLYLTGNPLPNDMDGTVQFWVMHDDFNNGHRVAFAP